MLTSVSFPNENVCFAGAEAEDGGTLENSQAESFTKEQSKVDEIKRSEKSESSKNEKSQSNFDWKVFDYCFFIGFVIGYLYFEMSKKRQRPVRFIHGDAPVYSNVN